MEYMLFLLTNKLQFITRRASETSEPNFLFFLEKYRNLYIHFKIDQSEVVSVTLEPLNKGSQTPPRGKIPAINRGVARIIFRRGAQGIT